MKFSKKISAALLAVTASALLCSGCGSKAQIGYFNSSRVMNESTKMQSIVNEANEKLRQVQEEALKMEMEQGASMPKEELDQKRQQYEMQMQSVNQSYMMQLRQQLDVALDDIAKKKNLDAVIANEPGQRTIYAGGVDVTEDIIEKLK